MQIGLVDHHDVAVIEGNLILDDVAGRIALTDRAVAARALDRLALPECERGRGVRLVQRFQSVPPVDLKWADACRRQRNTQVPCTTVMFSSTE